MEKLITTGRILFAVAFVGLGVEHLIFREFVTGRAPAWPEGVSGQVVWAYLTGIAFVVIGLAVLTGRKPRLALLFGATLIFVWALLRHLPLVATDSLFAPTWTRAGKALTFFGGALAIAGTWPKVESPNTAFRRFVNLDREFIVLGRICLGAFLIITGVQHFIHTDFVATLIPGWFPGDAVAWTYFAGVALIAFGTGLLIPTTAPFAALLAGCMVFSWFWIIHVPRAFVSVSDSISVFEALGVSGIGLAIAGFLLRRRSPA